MSMWVSSYMCTWKPEVFIECLPQLPSTFKTFFSFRLKVSVAWSSLTGHTGWIHLPTLPQPLDYRLLCRCYGFRHRSSRLPSKHFVDWAISPAQWLMMCFWITGCVQATGPLAASSRVHGTSLWILHLPPQLPLPPPLPAMCEAPRGDGEERAGTQV